MKRLFAVLLVFVTCLTLCSCGKVFSEKLFAGDGIYQEFDQLSDETRERLLSEAAREGYTMGFDAEGRITLSKDGKTFVLGESKKTMSPIGSGENND